MSAMWSTSSRVGAVLIGFMVVTLSPAFAGTSRFYPPSGKQAETLRLVQVMGFATRQEIVGLGQHYEHLLASGIPDSTLRDGSVATGRTYCCGGPIEEAMAVWFHVPNGLEISVGDIVEIEMGHKPRKADKGTVNVARRVREKYYVSPSRCRWMPPNERLWGRILYCDWMEAEGWKKVGGLNNTWLKEPADQK